MTSEPGAAVLISFDSWLLLMVMIIGMCITTIVAILSGLMARQSAKLSNQTVEQIETQLVTMIRSTNEIHRMVNSRLTEALTKIDDLEVKLFQATGEVPSSEPPRV